MKILKIRRTCNGDVEWGIGESTYLGNLKSHSFHIYSVRNDHGDEFKLGDMTDYGEIKSFSFVKDGNDVLFIYFSTNELSGCSINWLSNVAAIPMKKNEFEEIENRIHDLRKQAEELETDIKSLKRGKLKGKFKDGDWIHFSYKNDGYSIEYVFKFMDRKCNNGDAGCYLGVGMKHKKVFIHSEACDHFCNFNNDVNEYRLAEKEEVQMALRSMAEYKGFVKGVLVKALSGKTVIMDGGLIHYESIGSGGHDLLIFDSKNECNHWIYLDEDNKWAEIVNDFEIIPGYAVMYINDKYCEINKQRYEKKDIQMLLDAMMNINIKTTVIQSLQVGCEGQFRLTVGNLMDLLNNWTKL